MTSDKYSGYELFKKFSIIHRHSKIHIFQELKKLNLEHCHPPILMTIYFNPGLSQNDLAKTLKFNKGAVAKLIKKLESDGYIERSIDTNDKRSFNLYLTEKSKAIIPLIFSIEKDLSQQFASNLTDDEIEFLKITLDKIIGNLVGKDVSI